MDINLTSAKDIATIIFYLITSVIAMLTYRRAKATILQPKRTELIKKQTEIFSNFLSFINQNENSIDNGLDYVNLFGNNVDLVLRDFGLIEIDKVSEDYLQFNSNISGWIQFLENDIHNFIFAKGNLEDYDKLIFEIDNRARQKYYQKCLEENKFDVYRIFYTEKHEKFYKTLREFAFNPFLPSDVQKLALQIGKDLQENTHVVLRVLLKKLVLEYSNANNNKESINQIILAPEFSHQTLYRVFEKERIHHDKLFEELRKLIRKHLNIDEKW